MLSYSQCKSKVEQERFNITRIAPNFFLPTSTKHFADLSQNVRSEHVKFTKQ